MSSSKPRDDAAATSDAASTHDEHPTDAEAAATSAMFVFTADKAGMKGVDKQHVQEVVHKMSKDSSFYQKSLKDNEKVEQRVAAMKEKLASLTPAQQLRLQQEADVCVVQLEASRDLSRTVVVVDMDMFYAAVEMRDNPDLRDVPLAVGGLNMISTTNYAARKHGVRAAMPGFIGQELCPELQFVPVDMPKYQGVASQIREVFAEYDPDFEAFSLDEACLDLTDYAAKNWHKYAADAGFNVNAEKKEDSETEDEDDMQVVSTATGREAIASAIVREIRQKIFEHTQLTASAGIAVNVMLAKICSDMNKPNGQYSLPFTREGVLNFIRDLPVRKIGGIGKVTEKILSEALDVHTGGELFEQRGKVFHIFTPKTAEWLLQTSLAARERRERTVRKSFSRERTFRSMGDPLQLEAKCKEICVMLAADLEKAGKAAKNVAFIYKNTDFARSSRSTSLASSVFTADDLYANAVELLRRELPLTLRLMGVRASALVPYRHGSGSRSATQSTSYTVDNKKRQLVVKKFAEHVTEPLAAVLSTEAPAASTAAAKKATLKSSMEVYLAAGSDSNPAPSQLYPCPICNKLLDARSNLAVNAHMDACVLEKKRSSALSSSPLRSRPHKKPKKSSITTAFAATQDSESKSNEDTKPCPICGKQLNARNNMEVNAHMDACVIKDRSPALSSLRVSGKKRCTNEMDWATSTTTKKHENSIDVFFRRK